MKKNIWEGFKSDKHDFEEGLSIALTCDWVKKAYYAIQNGYGINRENLNSTISSYILSQGQLYDEEGEGRLWARIQMKMTKPILGQTISQVINYAKGSIQNGKKMFSIKVEKSKTGFVAAVYLDEVNSLFVYYDPNYGQIVQSDFRAFDKAVSKAVLDRYKRALSTGQEEEVWHAIELIPI